VQSSNQLLNKDFCFTLLMLFLWTLQVLEMYNEEVMCVYDSYFRIVAKDCAENVGDDDTLPMSGIRVGTKDLFEPSTEGNNLKWITFNVCDYHHYSVLRDWDVGAMY
jgi:hypothetical protein